MFGAIAYALMVQYYYGYGDSFTFYYGSNFFSSQVLQNSNNIKYFFASAAEIKSWFDFEVGDQSVSGYFGISSNVFIMKISAFLSVLSFNKYLIITLFFGFFSFAGLWRLFLVFKDINNNKELKILAWAILFVPSVWFWGSGLNKDSVCIGGTGFILYSMYKLFVKKEFSIKSILALIILIYIIIVIKSYIIIVLSVGISVFIFFKFISPFKNIVLRAIVISVFLFAVLTVAYVTNFSNQLQLLAEESLVQIDSFQRNYSNAINDDERSRATMETKEIDLSLGGLISYSPLAVFNCLYRPFIWESRKVFILLSALESMLLLISTLYIMFKLKFIGFFREILINPYILVSFIIAILFALIIGFTTYNFGTMARYKIILLPFFSFTLVSLYIAYKNKKTESPRIFNLSKQIVSTDDVG
jgi:hypothetical protein